MRKVLVLAILALTGTSANAGVHIEFGGRVMHIEVPRNCRSIACVHVSEGDTARAQSRKARQLEPRTAHEQANRFRSHGAESVGASAAATAVATAPAPAVATAPTPAAGDTSDYSVPAPGQQAKAASDLRASAASSPAAEDPTAKTQEPARSQPDPHNTVVRYLLPQDAAENPTAKSREPAGSQADEHTTVVDLLSPRVAAENAAPAPAPAPVYTVAADAPKVAAAQSEAPSPVGLWLTEKHEGKVRIEACGRALCGHVDGLPTEKVFIDMQPAQSNRWDGELRDPRTGKSYTGHISLKGPDALRLEACAFGGLMCGGETWTRVE